MNLKITLDENAMMPIKAHQSDSGLDLFSRDDVVVPHNSHAIIDTGVHIQIPEGMTGFLKSKSGLNVKHNIQSDGVIDAGYTGTIVVKLYNHGTEDYFISQGDKITQLVILPVPQITLTKVDTLDISERGNDGFGSSGR